VLITHCDYNTVDRTNVTLGGFSISDEMCVNYIHYYPHVPLEVCKSSVSDQALGTFFNYMKEWEGQSSVADRPISENYGAISWNRMRVQLLDEVYHEAPLSMQCNMSSGDRFPGNQECTFFCFIITCTCGKLKSIHSPNPQSHKTIRKSTSVNTIQPNQDFCQNKLQKNKYFH